MIIRPKPHLFGGDWAGDRRVSPARRPSAVPLRPLLVVAKALRPATGISIRGPIPGGAVCGRLGEDAFDRRRGSARLSTDRSCRGRGLRIHHARRAGRREGPAGRRLWAGMDGVFIGTDILARCEANEFSTHPTMRLTGRGGLATLFLLAAWSSEHKEIDTASSD